MTRIALIDYGSGNLHSARKGLLHAGSRFPGNALEVVVTRDAAEIDQADGLVLPGVGAFDPSVRKFREYGLETPIHRAIDAGKPFLGICVGLQMLFEGSDEGTEPGLGILSGRVKRFRPEPGLTIPHMGWNQLDLKPKDCPIWREVPEKPWVYFVHSYFAVPRDAAIIAATSTHGSQTFTAAVWKENVMATQFHPEKSSSLGLSLLENFLAFVQGTIPEKQKIEEKVRQV
jgi:imidazole glycerol-phosphate synthase subunit HisH